MKKFAAVLLILALVLSAFPALAEDGIKILLDGNTVDCKDVNGNRVDPFIKDGTTYVPLRAVASALNLDIEWDGATKTVFINGVTDSAITDNVNIYINGAPFTAKDVNGVVVYPVLENGTTYLPVRAIGEAFGKRVKWDGENNTVILTTPVLKTDFDQNKTYAIVNLANGKAISVTDSGLALEEFENYSYQGFKLTASSTEGYYHIQSIANGKNFDVNGNSKAPGGKIITYNASAADNQKFAIEITDSGYAIYALSSKLPVEDSAGALKQNTYRDSVAQRWDVVEFTPVEKANNTVYYTLSAGAYSLTDADSTSWVLNPNEDGEYIITNKATNKSLDVANNSKASGDPVITYATSGDANQRWILEKQTDGTYLIKSVHSSLYLTVTKDNNIVQAGLNESDKQCWTISIIK